MNVESPVLEKSGLCETEKNCPLYSNPHVIELLSQLNCSVGSIANNHICDWGADGLDETLKRLQDAKIKTVGAGLDVDKASTPVIVQLPEGSVGLLSYGDASINCKAASEDEFGCNPMNQEKMLDEIADLNKRCDVVIPQVHTGLTNYHFPLPSCRVLFRSLVDAGAAAVIGHHPHVAQGREVYRSAPIYYSLGNLVFAPILRSHGWMNLSLENCLSIVVALQIRNGKLHNWTEHHVMFDVDSNLVETVDPSQISAREARFQGWCKMLSDDLKKYESAYRRYVRARLLKRLAWRVHPKRWSEISPKHLTAFFQGMFRR